MICVKKSEVWWDKEPRLRHFRCLVREASATQSAAKISASTFKIEIKERKRLATSTVSIRQALNC
jgi:hypothetical protein